MSAADTAMGDFTLYLYGSQLTGQARPTSDYDLLYFTSARAIPEMSEMISEVYQVLGIPKNKKLDIKIYYLWKPKERSIFPAVIVHTGAKLIHGPDLKNLLKPPTVEGFIEFNKKDILYMLGKLNIKNELEFKEHFKKSQNLKPLYNVSFNLGNIEYMEQFDVLNCDCQKITSEHFLSAKSLLRGKYNYNKIDPKETQDLAELENIINSCAQRLRQLK